MPRTVMNGYSDRINHALAFAAKHHDQQVRRGTRRAVFDTTGEPGGHPHAIRLLTKTPSPPASCSTWLRTMRARTSPPDVLRASHRREVRRARAGDRADGLRTSRRRRGPGAQPGRATRGPARAPGSAHRRKDRCSPRRKRCTARERCWLTCGARSKRNRCGPASPAAGNALLDSHRRLHDRLAESGPSRRDPRRAARDRRRAAEIPADLGRARGLTSCAGGLRRVASRDIVVQQLQELGDDALALERDVQPAVDVHRCLRLLERARAARCRCARASTRRDRSRRNPSLPLAAPRRPGALRATRAFARAGTTGCPRPSAGRTSTWCGRSRDTRSPVARTAQPE